MGRICPILNHPLNDGVLIEDKALIHFIQKRNVDFLSTEYVCRSCKHEVTKLYNKKLKKAIELQRSRYHEGSISTLKTSKNSSSSSGASITSEHSVPSKEPQEKSTSEEVTQNVSINGANISTIPQKNGNDGHANENSNESGNSKEVSTRFAQRATYYDNDNFILQENQKNLANIQNSTLDVRNNTDPTKFKNVTMRKRTVRDFFTPKRNTTVPKETTALNVQKKTKSILQTGSSVRKTPIFQHVTFDTELENAKNIENSNNTKVSKENRASTKPVQVEIISVSKSLYDNSLLHNNNDEEVDRRLSQEPTTSKAAAAASATKSISSIPNSHKRPISHITDFEDDDDNDLPLSLNAVNGTRLPHIQPVPPKRKSQPDQPRPIVHDIMDNYIKDITGG